MMEQDMQEILFTPEALAQRVKELADQITQDYAGKSPLIVGTLRGSFVFMADLVRQINLPLTVDFLSASSYGSGTESSGQVKLKLDLADDISGRDVLIIEDIVDKNCSFRDYRKRSSGTSENSWKTEWKKFGKRRF